MNQKHIKITEFNPTKKKCLLSCFFILVYRLPRKLEPNNEAILNAIGIYPEKLLRSFLWRYKGSHSKTPYTNILSKHI